MMESTSWGVAVAAGLAVMLLLEAFWLLWSSRHGPQARRLAQRLKAVSAPPRGIAGPRPAGAAAAREQPRVLGRWLDRHLPPWIGQRLGQWGSVRRLQQWIETAGVALSPLEMLAISVAAGTGAMLLALGWRGSLVPAVGLAVLAALAPWVVLAQRRRQRQERIERQFPLALDLIGRALRAGHALSAALRMAAEELPDPLVQDFRRLFEALNYGEPLPQALTRFAQRVPLPDAGYFAVAVIVQRDTGGNLAEVLDQIAALVRDRLRLRGEIRTLSAEGRLSAVILTALPFGVATVVQVVNPGFLSPLWSDPVGRQMVALSMAGMVVGVWWMRALIRIRV